MPPISWTHNNEEADVVVATIRNMEKTFPAWPTPFNVLLLKIFLFEQGKGEALTDLIKGGTKENILEWMQVGLNASLCCVVKHMLQEEGFFCLQVLWLFMFHAKIGGNKWKWHLKHSKALWSCGGICTMFGYCLSN
jgi:hypothetical protein